MAVNSRAKGKVGELSACHDLKSMFGWNAHRTQQRTGWTDGNSPDIEVDEMRDIFFEIKRVEKLNLPRALALAVKQAGRRCPVVMHRPNRSVNGWMLTLRLEDLPRLVHAYTCAIDSEVKVTHSLAAPPLSDTHSGDRANR
jgi:hypothetical protein